MMESESGVRMPRGRLSGSAYTIRIESDGVIGGQTVKTKEDLVAKRLGDCP
jgi:hypothetical protein